MKIKAKQAAEIKYLRTLLKLHSIPTRTMDNITYVPLVKDPLTNLLHEYDKLDDCDLCKNDGTRIVDYLDHNGVHDRTWEYCECVQERGSKAHFKTYICKDIDNDRVLF